MVPCATRALTRAQPHGAVIAIECSRARARRRPLLGCIRSCRSRGYRVVLHRNVVPCGCSCGCSVLSRAVSHRSIDTRCMAWAGTGPTDYLPASTDGITALEARAPPRVLCVTSATDRRRLFTARRGPRPDQPAEPVGQPAVGAGPARCRHWHCSAVRAATCCERTALRCANRGAALRHAVPCRCCRRCWLCARM